MNATAPSQAETRTIVEVSLRETVTYTVPLRVYDMFTSVMDMWPFMYGRRPKVTVERVLDALERVYPDIRDTITVTRRANPPPTIRGYTATHIWHDTLSLDPAAGSEPSIAQNL